jgi:DNA-binding NarL/FixJ family response regulator
MYSAITPARASTIAPFADRGALPASRLVICDPVLLWAESIEAVVLNHTAWQVACVTKRTDTAAAATAACSAQAVLFDTREASESALLALVGQLRGARAGVELILLTGHPGVRYLRCAIGAGIGACVYKSEYSASLKEALRAVRTGQGYLSPAIVRTLDGARRRGRSTARPVDDVASAAICPGVRSDTNSA